MSAPLEGACLIGRARVKDASLWAEYCRRVSDTLVACDAALVTRAKHPLVLAGESDETDVVVIRFADRGSIEGWYRSAGYQALIPLRDAAAEVVIVAYTI